MPVIIQQVSDIEVISDIEDVYILKKFLPLNFHPVSNMPIFQQSWKSFDSKIKLEGSKNAEKINRSIEVEYCRR
jgi:hypothetical protein